MYGNSKSQAQGIVGRRESGSNILPALPSAQIAADNYLHASPAPAVGCKARVFHHALSGEAHALLSVQQRSTVICVCCIRSSGILNSGGRILAQRCVDRFRKSRRSTVLAYVETQAARLEANGKLGTARNYRGHSGVSPISWADGIFPFRSSMNGLWGSIRLAPAPGRCPQYRLVLYADIACGL